MRRYETAGGGRYRQGNHGGALPPLRVSCSGCSPPRARPCRWAPPSPKWATPPAKLHHRTRRWQPPPPLRLPLPPPAASVGTTGYLMRDVTPVGPTGGAAVEVAEPMVGVGVQHAPPAAPAIPAPVPAASPVAPSSREGGPPPVARRTPPGPRTLRRFGPHPGHRHGRPHHPRRCLEVPGRTSAGASICSDGCSGNARWLRTEHRRPPLPVPTKSACPSPPCAA